MKRNHVLTVMCGIILCMLTAANVFAQKTNFSGNWIIDPKVIYQDSFFLGEFSVLDNEDALTIKKITKDDYGIDPLWNRTLNYDGKVSEVRLPKNADGVTRTSVKSMKSIDDGKTIIITENRTREQDGEISKVKFIEFWTLSADGKKLTIKKELYEEGKVKPLSEIQAIYNRK